MIATALKFGRAPADAVQAAVASMTALNRAAADAIQTLPAGAVHACTDVTGFGLLGHASEMAGGSGCTIRIDAGRVPLLDGARALVHGNIPGGGRTNRQYFGAGAAIADDIDPDLLDLLFDPQTSGGLLVAIDPAFEAQASEALRRAGCQAARVGDVLASSADRLVIR